MPGKKRRLGVCVLAAHCRVDLDLLRHLSVSVSGLIGHWSDIINDKSWRSHLLWVMIALTHSFYWETREAWKQKSEKQTLLWTCTVEIPDSAGIQAIILHKIFEFFRWMDIFDPHNSFCQHCLDAFILSCWPCRCVLYAHLCSNSFHAFAVCLSLVLQGTHRCRF